MTSAPTPVMAQYLAAKEKNQDALLFFRMGDFYEVFFEDAKTASKALDIALTKRGNHNGEEIPMAGVPAHSVEAYLARLVKQGFKIALCDQLETPEEAKKRGYKAVVRRDVTRIITPGTLTEDSLLPARSNNILASFVFALGGLEAALAWCDVSTGEFKVLFSSPQRVLDEASALGIAEALVLERDLNRSEAKLFGALAGALTPRPNQKGDEKSLLRFLTTGFNVNSLNAFGDFNKTEIAALGLVYDYVQTTQAGDLPKLSAPFQEQVFSSLAIDATTRQSLEIEKNNKGSRSFSLIGAVDYTKTPQGARLLAQHINRPLLDKAKIEKRYDATQFFIENQQLKNTICAVLNNTSDMARPLSRLELNRGGPRDLGAILKGLQTANEINAFLSEDSPDLIKAAKGKMDFSIQIELADLAQHLRGLLAEELPYLTRDGGFVRRGYDAILDEHITLRDEGKRLIAALGEKINQQAGQQLKIKFNNVLGYFIEATPKQAPPLFAPPLSETFIHRQTLAQMVRFTTAELIELNSKIVRAADLALARELELFDVALEKTSKLSALIRACNDAIAMIDVSSANANYAQELDCTRPKLFDDTRFEIISGRHPVVEKALRKSGDIFTANDCQIDASGKTAPRLILLTGPNMAGKSTYLRQNALLTILAQAGLFVPAKEFSLGLVDRIFSRVGASDDLSAGQSTFMVEMVETAAILHRATEKSLVILDEIGRGTATYDGLALAWSVSEYLHNINKTRTIFATHYHELTILDAQLKFLGNSSMETKEWNGDLVFLHRVIKGAANRSYGIEVAKLAGLPQAAINRAKEVLQILENDLAKKHGGLDSLPLFSEPVQALAPKPSQIEAMLKEINPDSLSPREALDLIYELRSKLT